MKDDTNMTSEEWLSLLDLEAIADPFDKIEECQYFLDLASKETDVEHFRWLISAFLAAAYSFFEISAMNAYHAFSDPEGNPVEDDEGLEVLRRYVTVIQNVKHPSYVKTGGNHEVTKKLYEFRKKNTHHFPLSIMTTGLNVPEAFHFGNIVGQGTPALEFCHTAMSLMRQIHREFEI